MRSVSGEDMDAWRVSTRACERSREASTGVPEYRSAESHALVTELGGNGDAKHDRIINPVGSALVSPA